ILQEDPNSPTGGHDAEGVFLVRSLGMGFAKNRFTEITGGRMVFAATTQTPRVLLASIGHQIGGSELERQRFLLEFDDDAPQVLNQLAQKGLRVFAETA
ncbi:MAG: hypothetical protein ACXWLH_06450, partial [Candidatus Saccharimonadales bacterium]